MSRSFVQQLKLYLKQVLVRLHYASCVSSGAALLCSNHGKAASAFSVLGISRASWASWFSAPFSVLVLLITLSPLALVLSMFSCFLNVGKRVAVMLFLLFSLSVLSPAQAALFSLTSMPSALECTTAAVWTMLSGQLRLNTWWLFGSQDEGKDENTDPDNRRRMSSVDADHVNCAHDNSNRLERAEVNEKALKTADSERAGAKQRINAELPPLQIKMSELSDKEKKEYSQFVEYNLRPYEYGQQYIGRVTLQEYKEAWKRHIEELPSLKDCSFYEGGSVFTVYGRDCTVLNKFERIEAHSDRRGRLRSVLLIQRLGKTIPNDMMVRFLSHRYHAINPTYTPIAEVAQLSIDLCKVMEQLGVESGYKCDVHWFNSDGIYLYYKHSTFKDHDKAMLLFSNEDYFNNVERMLIMRRLAIIRQELAHNGIVDQSNGARERREHDNTD